MREDIKYELKTPIKYTTGSQGMVEGSFITITPPAFKHMESFVPIKQAFTNSVLKLQGNVATDDSNINDTNEKTEIDPNEAMTLLYNYPDDLSEIFKHARKLLSSGVAMIEGETKLTQSLIDDMALEDAEGLIGSYIVNFIMPSLISGT